MVFSVEKGQDPLQRTKTWLQRNHKKLTLPQCATPEEGATCTGGIGHAAANSAGPVTGTIILNTAYLELINWEDLQPYPEVIANLLNLSSSIKKKLFYICIIISSSIIPIINISIIYI